MLWWLAQNGVAAGLLTGLVALVCRLGRLGPAARHALWLIVLLKLVTPPVILWPWALPAFGEARHTEILAAVDGATSKPESRPLQSDTVALVVRVNSSPGEEFPLPVCRLADRDEKTVTNNQVPDSVPGRIYSPLQTLWLAGMVITCLLQILRIARFQRLLVHSDVAPRWLDNLVTEVAGKMRVNRPSTYIVPGIGSPLVWCLGRPKLLWPASLVERLPHHYHRSVVAHELAHLRRWDHWIGWLQLVAECVWWWNPLFWYVRRQLRLNAELACDALVLATLPDDRREYAEALIEVTQLLSQTAAPMPAVGIRSGARQDFERRLIMIMRNQVPCRVPFVGLLAIGVLAIVSLPGWSQPAVQDQKEDASGPEKRIIVTVPSDKDHQDAKRTITLVEENVVDKPVEAGTEPEKHIVLQFTKDIEWQDAKRVIGIAQKIAGDKPVVVGIEAKSDSSSERDRRIDKLEEQLRELLKEVQALRAGGSRPQTIWKAQPTTKPEEPSDKPRVRVIERKVIETKPGEVKHAPADTTPAWKSAPIGYEKVPSSDIHYKVLGPMDGKKTAGAVTLVRTTYKIPHAKAEALATLLKEHGADNVLETNVEGDSLIITTTPEAQRTISEFMALLEQMGTRRTAIKVH
jgi:beta-lactamase regulating signal transducer with metallopeptidase domain